MDNKVPIDFGRLLEPQPNFAEETRAIKEILLYDSQFVIDSYKQGVVQLHPNEAYYEQILLGHLQPRSEFPDFAVQQVLDLEDHIEESGRGFVVDLIERAVELGNAPWLTDRDDDDEC